MTEHSLTVSILNKRQKELVRRATPSELLFKRKLENSKIDFSFQYIIYPYVVDFFLPNSMTIIELDGGYHDAKEQVEYDKRRDKYCHDKGFKIIRIKNEDVETYSTKPLLKKNRKPKQPKNKKVRKKKIFVRKSKKDTDLHRLFRKGIMDIFRSIPSDKKIEYGKMTIHYLNNLGKKK